MPDKSNAIESKIIGLEKQIDVDGRLVRIETEFSYLKKLVPTVAVLASSFVGALLYIFFNITAENINKNVEEILGNSQIQAIEKEASRRAEKLSVIVEETILTSEKYKSISESLDHSSAEALETISTINSMIESDYLPLKTRLDSELASVENLSEKFEKSIKLEVELKKRIMELEESLLQLRTLASSITQAEERIRSGKELAGSSWLVRGGGTLWVLDFIDGNTLKYCAMGGRCISDAVWKYTEGFIHISGTWDADGHAEPIIMTALISRSIIVGGIEEWPGSKSWNWVAVPR